MLLRVVMPLQTHLITYITPSCLCWMPMLYNTLVCVWWMLLHLSFPSDWSLVVVPFICHASVAVSLSLQLWELSKQQLQTICCTCISACSDLSECLSPAHPELDCEDDRRHCYDNVCICSRWPQFGGGGGGGFGN